MSRGGRGAKESRVQTEGGQRIAENTQRVGGQRKGVFCILHVLLLMFALLTPSPPTSFSPATEQSMCHITTAGKKLGCFNLLQVKERCSAMCKPWQHCNTNMTEPCCLYKKPGGWVLQLSDAPEQGVLSGFGGGWALEVPLVSQSNTFEK